MQTVARLTPCSDLGSSQLDLLREVAKMQMGQGLDYDSKIMDRARRRSQERFEGAQRDKEELKSELEHLEAEQMQQAIQQLLKQGADTDELLESLEADEGRRRLSARITQLNQESQGLTKEDFDDVLSEFDKRGLTYAKKPRVTLTSKGARLLGQGFLSRVLQRLSRKGVGPHRIQDIGHGPWIASTLRPYEVGDSYERLSIIHSLLAALERGGRFGEMGIDDFRVFEAIHSTEVQFGILVDQSASMNRGSKLEAAVETALAMSELMKTQFPEDRLRLYAFSEEVREVEPWELPGIAVPMGYTDIRAALMVFRRSVTHESGNKQAHLITDSAPNFEEDEYIGFERAFAGLLDEARRYRASGITLNIVMLDDDPRRAEMAQKLAQENLGRVFFVRPGELGDVVVEDYLISKREYLHL
jgi:uncharacterized protein with von Willebrand factor type A (vWA) domain